ncbi:unnamed protein product, partial [Meganyctiphanes norvegica]
MVFFNIKDFQKKKLKNNYGCFYTALYNYDKQSDGELTIRERDTLRILNTDDYNWWYAYNTATQEQGFVPVTCIVELAVQNPYGNVMYIALYNYDKPSEDELSIKEGDTLELLDKDDQNYWWFAYNIVTKKQGYVPSDYIAEVDSLQAQPWYFGNLNRTEVHRNLMLSTNETGSFLVRDSLSPGQSGESTPYTLSVRIGQNAIHYRIGKSENAWYVTILPNIILNSVQDLISYYKHNPGLCCKLRKSCNRPEKPLTESLSHTDEWELDKTAVKLNKKIGNGQFGDVYEGTVSNTQVAIKTLKRGTMNPENFLAEAKLMKQLRHKNLIQLYAVCTKDEPIYIITEFMINGDLLNYLRNGKGKNLIENTLIDISAQIATAMSYLEEKNFIHRDLAARNVLVGRENIVKIADFGLARVIEGSEYYKAREGAKFPVKWTAPEAITYSKFTIKSDVWSFGILLYEIITRGKNPYPGIPNNEVIELVNKGERMLKDNMCPQKLYDIMLKCWNEDPNTRPTFQILKIVFQACPKLLV